MACHPVIIRLNDLQFNETNLSGQEYPGWNIFVFILNVNLGEGYSISFFIYFFLSLGLGVE